MCSGSPTTLTRHASVSTQSVGLVCEDGSPPRVPRVAPELGLVACQSTQRRGDSRGRTVTDRFAGATRQQKKGTEGISTGAAAIG